MVLRIQMAKFKPRQYLLRANSPNLMLVKLSRYTVYHAKFESENGAYGILSKHTRALYTQQHYSYLCFIQPSFDGIYTIL